MSQTDWENGAISAPKDAAATDWEQGDLSQPAARGLKGWAKDIGATALKGAIAVPEALVGLADIPTGGRVGKFLENEGGAVGFRPKEAMAIANDMHSDATKEAQRKFAAADGIVDKAVTAIQNPSLIATAIGESLPSMGAGGLVGRGILAAAPKVSAVVAGAAGEGLTMAGSAAEQIRQETKDGLLTPVQSGAALATGVVGGAVGVASGKLANRLGIGNAETMMAQGTKGMAKQFADDAATAATNPLTQQAAKGIPRQVIEGAITEGLLEELPQSMAEQILQNLALDKPWQEGLDDAIVMGALSGGAMGAGAAGFHAYKAPKAGAVAGDAQATAGSPASAPASEQAGAPQVGPGLARVREAFQAQMDTLLQQEAGEPSVPQTAPPDGAAALAQQQAAAEQVRQADMAASRAVTSPDDEIHQSIGAEVAQAPMLPSRAMGLDANAGSLSAAAVLAVDSGAFAPVAETVNESKTLSLEEVDALDQAAYEQFFASLDAENQVGAVVGRYLEDDADIPDFAAGSNVSDEDFLRALGATDEDIQDAITFASQSAGTPSGLTHAAFAQTHVAQDARQGTGAASSQQQSPGQRIAELEQQADAADAEAADWSGREYKANRKALPKHEAKGGPADVAEANEQRRLKAILKAKTTASAARKEAAQLTAQGNAEAAMAGQVDLAAARSKQLINLSDPEIEALVQHYGPTHPRTKKLQKEAQGRALTAQPAIKGEAENAHQTPEPQQASPQQAQAGAAQARTAAAAAAAAVVAAPVQASGLNDGSPSTANAGAQSPAARTTQGAAQAAPESTTGQLKQAGARWASMPVAERDAVAARTDLKGVLKRNVKDATWEKLHADVQRKLATAMAPKNTTENVASKLDAADGVAVNEQKVQAVVVAASEAATSPDNDLPEPTQAQKDAGNYKKGHVTLNGHDIAIENPAGTQRNPKWPALQNHYGYIKGSVGADKDHVDVFMTDRAHEPDLPVFVVDQNNRDGSFDEHKVIMGAATEAEARSTYLGNYSKGWTGLGAITQMTQDEFKAWVRDPAKTVAPASPPTVDDSTKAAAASKPRSVASKVAKAKGAKLAAATVQAQGEGAAAKPAKPKSVPAKVKAAIAARVNYFTPGNIVKSYGGHDRVISYSPGEGDFAQWSVTVRAVQKEGDDWVDVPKERERTHATPPDAKALAAGPVQVAMEPEDAPVQFSQQMSLELAQALLKIRQPVRATKDSVRAAVRELVNGLGSMPNGLGRVVVATAAEIRSQWEPLIGPVAMASEDAGHAQGFYDPKTKTVFLIADHINVGDELGVVAHELMHKHGQAVLGEEGWNQLHGAISTWAQAPVGSTERKVYDEAAARVEQSGPELSTQELFPYAVQVALEMGLRPNAVAQHGTVARWLSQVRSMLRGVWNKIAPGKGKGDFNSLDLVNLAFGIAQRENPEHQGELDAATQEQVEQVQDALKRISDSEDLFALPKSTQSTVAGIAAEHDEQIKVSTTELGGETMYTLTLENGTKATITSREPTKDEVFGMDESSGRWITERPGEKAPPVGSRSDVWLDVSGLKPGKWGGVVYNIASTFAHNTGRVFIGDPSGLSDLALRRRPEQMLASALKFGTTDHIAPHPRQAAGDAALGVPPLRWVYGDHAGNIERLIDVNQQALENAYPETKNIRYDFDTGQFIDHSTGDILFRDGSVSSFDRRGARGDGAPAGGGWRSIARNALFRSAQQVASGVSSRDGRGRVLAQSSGDGAGRDSAGNSPGTGAARGSLRGGDGQTQLAEVARGLAHLNREDPAHRIFYSRSKLAEIKDSALNQVHQSLSHPGKVSLWDKTVGTMRHLAERNPLFKPVFESAQRHIDDVSMLANDAADMAPRILPRVENLRDMAKKPLSSEDNKAMGRALFEGTQLWGRDADGKPVLADDLAKQYANLPAGKKGQMLLAAGRIDAVTLRNWQSLPMEQFESIVNSIFESKMLKPGIVWKDSELRELMGLNAQQISLYREARAAVDRSLDVTARADMLRLLGEEYAGMRDMVLEQDSLQDAMELLTSTLMEDAKEKPDMSDRLMQLHNQVVDRATQMRDLMDSGYMPLTRFGQYTVDVVDASGERQYFGMFESQRESNQMALRMKTEYPGAKVVQGTMSQEAFKLFQGVTPESMELFGNMLGLESKGNEAKDKAFQAYVQLTKNNHSAMKRLIHRKGTAGYSEDVGRVLASFVYSNARQASGALNAGAMEKAIMDIEALKGQGELVDVAMGLRSYIQDPQEEGQAVRGMLFAQYLGGSVASAFVNMTQPFAVTMPWLSQFGGMKKASGHLARALKDMSTRGFKYEEGLAHALKMAEEDGTTSPQEIHQLMAQSRGAGALRSGDGTRAGDMRAAAANNWERVKVAWGQPFALAEQFNRRSTFIAAYRMAQEGGKMEPAAFARKAVLETQFLYSKANKMKWARGTVGGTLMTFKTYSVSYLELMQRTWNAGEPGSPERAAGRRAVGWALATLMLMGGAGGLPFMEDLEDVIDGLAQMMGYNMSAKQWRKEAMAELLGKELAEFMEQGLSGLPGAPVDVSGRLGMGNLLPGTGLLQTKQSHTRDLLELAGPAGDLVSRAFSGLGRALKGDVAGAALDVSPTAVRNAAKGVDMAASGIYKDTKGYKVIDTTLDEALAKFIGFQPKSVAEVQEANSFMLRSKSFFVQNSSEIKAQWADALFRKDDAALEQVRERLAAWNRNNPEQTIVVKMPDVWKKVREMGKDRTDRIADTAPKALRGQMREMAQEVSR